MSNLSIDLSIIVPIYNCENYIDRCIHSLLNLPIKDYEIILIDDGSTDNSFNICKKYSNDISIIRFFLNEKKGVSSARNYGIQKSCGNYLCFIDADDEVIPNAFYQFFDKTKGHDFCMASYETIFTKRKPIIHESFSINGNIKEFLSHIYYYIKASLIQGPCWKIFRADIVKHNKIIFPEDMSLGEDACFVYEYLKCCENVSVVTDVVYRYYVNEGSLSHHFRKDKLEINNMLNNKIKALCDYYSVEYDNYDECNVQNYYAYMNELISSNVEGKLSIIKATFSSKVLISSLKVMKGLKDKIIYFLYKNKLAVCIYLIFKFNQKRRRAFK